jgi:Protein kinase domain
MTNTSFGQQILRDRYRIIRQLGRNAGRRTLLAQDLHTQELVVLKILTFNSDFRWDDLKLFEREAETLKSLCHSAIPRYRDYFELNLPKCPGFVLVQTYIDATSLQDWIKQGRTFSESEVKQIAKALLNVLMYLHDRNPPAIHRDIKPSNILLTSERTAHQVGNLYLVDFGSVQTTVKKTGTMTIVGTYGYMPPEQFSGRAFPASDLYSLGATLIYLVTGTHPADLIQEDLQIKFEDVTHLSASFVQWLKQITHPNRQQRFTSAQEALEALENPKSQPQLVESTASTRLPLQKPADSKISLRKDAETLEIYLPPQNGGSGCLFLFALCFIAMSIPGLFAALFTGHWGGVLFALFFSLPGISLLWQIVFVANADQYIHFDRTSMSVTLTRFGIRRRVFQASRDRLYKLTYVKRLYYRDSEGGIVEVPPELKIWAKQSNKTSSYTIGKSLNSDSEMAFLGLLTMQEVDWLAQELSDWLKLPITRE